MLGLRDASGAVQGTLEVFEGDWICVELQVNVDAGGGNDGSLTMWTGNNRVRIGSLDQAALTGVRFGAMNQSGDFAGNLYFDEVIFDTARLYQDSSPDNLSFAGKTMPIFKSGFAFVGAGAIDGATLIDGGSGDCTLKIFDTDDVNYAYDMLKEALSDAGCGARWCTASPSATSSTCSRSSAAATCCSPAPTRARCCGSALPKRARKLGRSFGRPASRSSSIPASGVVFLLCSFYPPAPTRQAS